MFRHTDLGHQIISHKIWKIVTFSPSTAARSEETTPVELLLLFRLLRLLRLHDWASRMLHIRARWRLLNFPGSVWW
jgi:hypothetical protein